MKCQSCGMPADNEEDYGTEADGSKNYEYCCYCYQNGKFTDEGITVEEKIEKNIQVAVRMGMDEDKAKELAGKVIPTLKRWKK
ncbi:transcriptional regulator [Candidatus Woesearchaeota archaeon CG10_big_fil_rev_8_21_14_0_10_34_8]|nr:MAG: transcriptional regulator [Candidatus Woesearchaeota archaeon CG10_big_fil_rev_8_21_14_0_10_34_8]